MTEGLTRRQRWAYASVAFALVCVELPVNLRVPELYADAVGVPLGAIAAALLCARIFDALNDPLIGLLSDRTDTRWGRRRPWIFLAAAPLALCFYALLAPPSLHAHKAAYLLAGLMATDLFFTAVSVPHDALGVEVTRGYDERTRVLGFRDGVGLLGVAFAALLPGLLVRLAKLPATPAGERRMMALFGAIVAPMLVASAWTCVASIGSGSRAWRQGLSSPLRARLRDLWGNRPFRIFLTSFTLGGIATQLPVTLHLFFVRYVMRVERPDTFLPVFVLSAIVSVPGWLWLAQRFEKRTAWVAALTWSGVAQALTWFAHAHGSWRFALLTAATGVPFGAQVVLPTAIQADVIDWGAHDTGGRRDEGLYLGVWSVARKLNGALAAAVGLWVLDRAGFVPNAVQSQRVELALRSLYTWIPAALSLAAGWAFLRYPIDRATHTRLASAREASTIVPAPGQRASSA